MIPLRRWKDGALLGFNRRNTSEHFELFGYPKYAFTQGFNKFQNVYGYYENKEVIEEQGYVTVFEAEKAVIRRFCNGDCSCISTFGKYYTRKQIEIIDTLSVNEVILAYDEDVNINEVRHFCE